MFAVFGEEDKKNAWGALFDVEDPRSKIPQNKGKVLDIYQALEVARHDIQYLDWRARQDVLTIMLLHEKVSTSFILLLLYRIGLMPELCCFLMFIILTFIILVSGSD